MKVLVLGASLKSERYSNMAILRLLSYGHEVVALGNKEGVVAGISIQRGTPSIDGIHTVTLYLNPDNQKPYYDYILSLKPSRVIFNPGTENQDFENLLKQHGIQTEEACTLVMLGAGTF